MTVALALALIGLALVDSINTSTLITVATILLVARRPAATGWAYAIGAFLSFMVLAFALYFGAQVANEAIAEFSVWARRVIFVILAIVLAVFGVRKLKTRQRRGIPKLPAWVNPYTGVFLGAIATVGDIANAFPLLLAIDRTVDTGLATTIAVPTLVIYSLIYALPTFLLLILGLAYRDKVVAKLERVLNKISAGKSKASWKMASMWFGLALASFAAALFMR